MSEVREAADPRPTFTVNGVDRLELNKKLLRVLIVEEEGGLSRCEVTFANWGERDGEPGYLYFRRDLLEFGRPFVVKRGNETLFDGRISALEGHFPEGAAPEVVVLAEDRLQDLRMTRRTRCFEGVTDADVFQRIASAHSLTPSVDVRGPTHAVLAQVNLSDLAFVRERARAVDADVWVDGRALHVAARSGRTSSPVELVYGSGLRSFRVAADLAHQRTSVRATGWSRGDKDAISAEATDQCVQSELGGGESGASVLRAAFGERKEVLAHGAPASGDEARARAEAYFRQSARRFVSGEGVVGPDVALRAGRRVNVKNVGALFEGSYHVAETRWIYDERGARVVFRAERPGLGRAA
jgi:hypothetical protein